MKKPLKIGVYLRVSTDKQVQVFEGSLETQKFRMEEFVRGRNREVSRWGDIVEFYVEEGFSAGTAKRPAYQRMMRDIRSGRINLILVADISRLSRNTHDFSVLLKELEQFNASFLSLKEQFDTSTPAGRMMINMVVTMAQFEREQTSERVSINCNSRALRGFRNGAPIVMGFSRHPDKAGVLLINEKEANQVRTIFRVFQEQGSLGKTIPVLEALEILPRPLRKRSGEIVQRKWSYSSLHGVLTNRAYIGLREVNRKNRDRDQQGLKPWQQYKVVKAAWPSIIDGETFSEVQGILQENLKSERRRLDSGEHRVFLLSGVLRCGECGRPLNGQSAHGKTNVHRYYAHAYRRGEPQNCSVKRIHADEIEQKVVNHFVEIAGRAGYFDDLEGKLSEMANGTKEDVGGEVTKVMDLLKGIEAEVLSTFRVQTQVTLGTEAAKLAGEHLEMLGRKRTVLQSHLEKLQEMQNGSEDVGAIRQGIETRILAFKRGYAKATPASRRRLVRQMLERLVFTPAGLEVHFPVHELATERAEHPSGLGGAGPNALRLERKAKPASPSGEADVDLSLSFGKLLNLGIGWGGRTRTCE